LEPFVLIVLLDHSLDHLSSSNGENSETDGKNYYNAQVGKC